MTGTSLTMENIYNGDSETMDTFKTLKGFTNRPDAKNTLIKDINNPEKIEVILL